MAEDIGRRVVGGSGLSVVLAAAHGAVEAVAALEEDSVAASVEAVALVVGAPAGHGKQTEI